MVTAIVPEGKRGAPELLWRETVCPEDAEAVRSLVAATEMFTPEEVDIAVELVAERLTKGPASGYEFVIAEAGGRLAGYACYGPTPATIGDVVWTAMITATTPAAVAPTSTAFPNQIGNRNRTFDSNATRSIRPAASAQCDDSTGSRFTCERSLQKPSAARSVWPSATAASIRANAS